MNFIKIITVSLFLNLLLNNVVFAESSVIHYDGDEKILSIKVQQVSLQYLLGRISSETGFEILTEDDFDLNTRVSLDMSGSIHKLLPRIFRQMSIAVYDGGDKGSTITILPQGSDQSDYLSIGKSVRPIVVNESDTVESINRNKHRRDYSTDEWRLKKSNERAKRKQDVE